MNRHAKLQEIYDESIVNTLASSNDFNIIKQAGLWDELGFGSIASVIKDQVQTHVVKENSKEGYLDALGNVLLSGALFKIHPVLGIANTVAGALGVDVIGIISKVFGAAKSALMQGGTLSESTFNSLTKTAFSKNQLKKEAQIFSRRRSLNTPDIPFLPKKNQSVIVRVFGNLFAKGKRTRASWLAKGIIIWALKTALLGAGLLTTTGMVTSFVKDLTDKKSEETPTETIEMPGKHEQAYVAPKQEKYVSKLRSSGAGEKVFKNDLDHMWIVPLIGNISNTVLAWTEEIYPQLSGYDHIIKSNPAFQRTVALLGRDRSSTSQDSLLVPPGFTSRKQVVDLFAHEAAKGLI